MTPLNLATDYTNALRTVVAALKRYFSGVERVGRPGVLAGKTHEGEYKRGGTIPGVGEFSFYGIGCLVVQEDESLVDFDWDPMGHEIFDVSRIRRFARSRGIADGDVSTLLHACRQLAEDGLLIEAPLGWFRLQ